MNAEIRQKAGALKLDVEFAIIIAKATEAPYAALQNDKAEEIFKLLNEISEESEAET